jgi:hypothetical protein
MVTCIPTFDATSYRLIWWILQTFNWRRKNLYSPMLVIYTVSKHRHKTWQYHLPFDRFRRLRACRQLRSCQSESGRTAVSTTGLEKVACQKTIRRPLVCSNENRKKVVLVVQWRILTHPTLRLSTSQRFVGVKPRCHGDALGISSGSTYHDIALSRQTRALFK